MVSINHGEIQSKGTAFDVLGITPDAAHIALPGQSESPDEVGHGADLENVAAPDPKEGKLVIAEEKSIGRVSWNACA